MVSFAFTVGAKLIIMNALSIFIYICGMQTLVPQKKKDKLGKDVINIIRTTQRNNIDLTNIADNKANVLLSLNGIMLTFALPVILANTDMILERWLHVPLIILGITCFTTMYIAATVLKPSNFQKFHDKGDNTGRVSPFFFGNFYKMSPNQFYSYIEETLQEKELIRRHIMQDLFYIGKRLGEKMDRMRLAFNIFITGIFLTLVSTALIIWLL